jgi:hypothetical protein
VAIHSHAAHQAPALRRERMSLRLIASLRMKSFHFEALGHRTVQSFLRVGDHQLRRRLFKPVLQSRLLDRETLQHFAVAILPSPRRGDIERATDVAL